MKTCKDLGIELCDTCEEVGGNPNSWVVCNIAWAHDYLECHKTDMKNELLTMITEKWYSLHWYHRAVQLFYPEYAGWMDKMMVLK
jgi:hypothetical protein